MRVGKVFVDVCAGRVDGGSCARKRVASRRVVNARRQIVHRSAQEMQKEVGGDSGSVARIFISICWSIRLRLVRIRRDGWV
jgi:hypothetical protein